MSYREPGEGTSVDAKGEEAGGDPGNLTVFGRFGYLHNRPWRSILGFAATLTVVLQVGISLIVTGSSITFLSPQHLTEPTQGVLNIVNNKLKTTALSFGVAAMLGSLAFPICSMAQDETRLERHVSNSKSDRVDRDTREQKNDASDTSARNDRNFKNQIQDQNDRYRRNEQNDKNDKNDRAVRKAKNDRDDMNH